MYSILKEYTSLKKDSECLSKGLKIKKGTWLLPAEYSIGKYFLDV